MDVLEGGGGESPGVGGLRKERPEGSPASGPVAQGGGEEACGAVESPVRLELAPNRLVTASPGRPFARHV